MTRLRCRSRGWLMALLTLLAPTAFACKLPVFRFALERWPADRYKMVVIVDESTRSRLDAAQAEIEVIAQSHANLDVETIDLSKLSDEELWQVESWDGESPPPLMQVFYPPRDGTQRLCWSGELTPETIGQWRDSSLRQSIISELVKGVSAVWILVEGNDATENDQCAERLAAELDRAADTITLQDGILTRAQAAELTREQKSFSMDDVLRSEIPLKVEFTYQRLAFQDDSEPALRAMLAGGPSESSGSAVAGASATMPERGPQLFAVFGRGRVMPPIDGRKMSDQAVIEACRYIVGQCNCTVKTLNPGVDLILDSDWRNSVGDSLLIVEPAISSSPEPLAIPPGKGAPPSKSSANDADARGTDATKKPASVFPLEKVLAGVMFAGIVAVAVWRFRPTTL